MASASGVFEGLRLQGLDDWLTHLSRGSVLIELGTLLACLLLAWLLVVATRRALPAELELPGLPYGLAIEFQPPRPVDFDGQAVEFTLAGDAADHWSFGFCPAGGLESWRSRR